MKKIISRVARGFFVITIVVSVLSVVGTIALLTLKEPSHEKKWEFGQQRLQTISFADGRIQVENLRDYDWAKTGSEENYTSHKFALSDITGIEVGVSHFSPRADIAHVFLIFTLENGNDIGLSIEARREKDELFTLTQGLFVQYELMYIFASKNDLVSLREKRGEELHLYPIRTSPDKAQQAFVLLAKRANEIAAQPEFYHPILKNCTNQIVREIEKITEKKFPLYEKTFAPGFSGQALFDIDLIETMSSDFAEVKESFLVDFTERYE